MLEMQLAKPIKKYNLGGGVAALYCRLSRDDELDGESASKSEQEKIRFRINEINRIIQKLYEDNVNGRITDERFDLLSKTYENEQAELRNKEKLLKESVRKVEREEQNLARFVRIVKKYVDVEELTPEIINAFIDRIEVGKKEKYCGRKMQDMIIVYNFVGAIELPQYGNR